MIDDEMITSEELRLEYIKAAAPDRGHAAVHQSGTFDMCRGVVKNRFRELISLAIELTHD